MRINDAVNLSFLGVPLALPKSQASQGRFCLRDARTSKVVLLLVGLDRIFPSRPWRFAPYRRG
ncbi:unnamed protein product [Penicillium camemberti]|uniref:Str. FM013 n=1 Tax=Penicillium camemberti (strain FM 013) TaxID=1429867 RepID=A0A0G4PNE5_PENC3|nr:unnamed protein product [Penicillium camemberti]